MKINIPPLLLCLVCAGLMYFISRYTWSFEAWGVVRIALAVILLSVSFICVGLGASLFKKKKTTVNPVRPEKAKYLVTSGIYSISRNPMYLGFSLGLLSWSVFLGNILSLFFVFAFTAYMNYVQIRTEERALYGLFGEQFRQYKNRVRRWI